MKHYTMKDYEIFKEVDGMWKVVRTGPDGVRRNIATQSIITRREAEQVARDDRDALNVARD